jgi:hypothetical protein
MKLLRLPRQNVSKRFDFQVIHEGSLSMTDSKPSSPYLSQPPTVTSDRAKRGDAKPALPLRDVLAILALRLVGHRLWGMSYTLFSESRSFLGRLRIQLAKDRVFVSLGPSLEFHRPLWVRNKRTLARKQGIENLLATRPWLTHLDFETFLMGFDAGAQWAFGTMGNKPHPDQDSSCNAPDSH